MLAYVFWHWPNPVVPNEQYLQKLRLFHQTLSANGPEGFSHSLVFELPNPPWLRAEGVAYEDWYLLHDSAALDRLNLAAVSGDNEQPHNQVAAEAAGGTAGLYRLKQGDEAALAKSTFAVWFSKAQGITYPNLYFELSSLTSRAGVALWYRQMTLGPTTEFCLRSETGLDVPAGITTDLCSLPVRKVWG